MGEITQRVVIVTGGSRGIGAGLVDGYRQQGWAVVANSLDIKPSTDPDILTVQGDVSEQASADQIIGQPLDRFGRIDGVAPGIIQTPLHPAESYTPEALAGKLPPLGRVGQVSDIVDGILYLESAPYVTGEILYIDGGRTA